MGIRDNEREVATALQPAVYYEWPWPYTTSVRGSTALCYWTWPRATARAIRFAIPTLPLKPRRVPWRPRSVLPLYSVELSSGRRPFGRS